MSRTKPPKPKNTEMLSVRLEPATLKKIRRFANVDGISQSELITRMITRDTARRARK